MLNVFSTLPTTFLYLCLANESLSSITSEDYTKNKNAFTDEKGKKKKNLSGLTIFDRSIIWGRFGNAKTKHSSLSL